MVSRSLRIVLACAALAVCAAAQQTPKVTLESSETVFSVMAALNACGYNHVLFDPSGVYLAALRIVKLSPADYYLTIPQDLHDPQIKRVGFRVSKNTHALPPFRLGELRGPESLGRFSKNIRTVPTYVVYGRIARLLRVSPEGGLFLTA